MKKIVSNLKITMDKYKKQLASMRTAIYKNDTIILYAGQKPIAPFLIVKGSVSIKKNKKDVTKFGPGVIVGHLEYLGHIKIDYDVEISAGTKIAWIEKSMLENLLGTSVQQVG